MSEKALRKYVASLIEGHCCQVESHATANGIPDTNFCVNGVEGWVELKFVRNNDKIKVRPSQWVWAKRRIAAGGTVYFLVRHVRGQATLHYLMKVSDLAALDVLRSDTTPASWAIRAKRTWAKSIDSDALNCILRGEEDDWN